MTQTDSLSNRDRRDLGGAGISSAEVQRQLHLLRHPPPSVRLLRSCRLDDGIVRIENDSQTEYVNRWRTLCRERRLAKFVPASGAATRMFKDLEISPDPPLESGSWKLLQSLGDFAFHDRLMRSLEEQGLDLGTLLTDSQLEPVLTALLGSPGLDYRSRPKGLILFHAYPEGARTALEEQLSEGCGYLSAPGETCRFHFTVTDSHLMSFEEQLDESRTDLESRAGATVEVSFSTQSPATDTLALDDRLLPVRRADGRLLLRPAGHGALLENLQSVDADVVFIKNIDNVSHRRLHSISIHWKRILAGYFMKLQERIFTVLDLLEESPQDSARVDRALRWIQTSLAIELPREISSAPLEARHRYAVDRLDRPLRICGMVKNEGEPGGGPFWLADETGGATGQIVESAQIDITESEQEEIWRSSTHFNPVDLVCGLRDRNGRAYALADFVDPSTSLVAEKSYAGRPIKVLERPGLWNGSMARWNTAFVEVPSETFTPVKTIFDLLRPEHRD